MQYYMIAKGNGSSDQWERCTAQTIIDAKREAGYHFLSADPEAILCIASRDGIEKTLNLQYVKFRWEKQWRIVSLPIT